MFNFDGAEFRYEPYPIGLIRPIMEPALYDALVDSFPPLELFKFFPGIGKKYSLSEKFNPGKYHDFIAQNSTWRELHAWVKSKAFFRSVDKMLRANYIDLGFKSANFSEATIWGWRLSEMMKGHWPSGDRTFRTRFEFSMLPADGGVIKPHTDSTRKVATLIVSMAKAGEWDPSYGGGTDVNKPKDHRYTYNYLNNKVPFDEIELLHTYEFQPNQCIIFIKTFNSLHSVRPMTVTGSKAMRRTLTINIERQG